MGYVHRPGGVPDRHSEQPYTEKAPPEVSAALLDRLVLQFPNRLPTAVIPPEALGELVGEQRVIRCLLSFYEQNNGSPYVQRESAKSAPRTGHRTDGGPAP